jgi:hypothetical protein
MALQVTEVASPLLAARPATMRRPVTASGQPASSEAVETTADQGNSSFLSLLTRSSAAEEMAAATAAGGNRPVTATTPAAASSATGSASAASDASSTTGASGLSDFELLFGGANYNPADPMAASRAASPDSPDSSNSASAAQATTPPTAQSVFGPNVWVTDPVGLNPDGTSFEYNPFYFATESTAQTVAQMVGGSVITENVFTQPGDALFVQQQPNYMVQMSNGAVINPGLVASFYTFGFSQTQIDTMVAQEVANTPSPVQTT